MRASFFSLSLLTFFKTLTHIQMYMHTNLLVKDLFFGSHVRGSKVGPTTSCLAQTKACYWPRRFHFLFPDWSDIYLITLAAAMLDKIACKNFVSSMSKKI